MGLHGRIANTGAEDVCVRQGWENGGYVISVSGKTREACLHAENYTLERKLETSLRSKEIKITDIIVNNSQYEQPLMLLYHINVGYPILDEGARFFSSKTRVLPNSPKAQEDPEGYRAAGLPVLGIEEKCYFHTLEETDGCRTAGIVNDKLQLAFYVRFKNLNSFTQWKMENVCEYATRWGGKPRKKKERWRPCRLGEKKKGGIGVRRGRGTEEIEALTRIGG